ncbi:LOW QUALITY PROTEIN: cinnamoyl-CoA reductase 1 isoform X2 [Populus alba x Populus x berolinensis]|nr:LOW QUALITY PROTEIN: cinnamoyl-CoA reductase 1 isoform X2 [Populus alba x Populus x berolinensis]
MSGEGKVVCVTGGSGYIASWLVKLLLLRGYTVKATVRDPNDPKRTEHLLNLDGAKERLHLFKANLVEEGSFDPVVDGCESVFHVASPVLLGTNDPQADLIEPAVKGTLNVLKSCAKFPCVKRVILTSSMASVAFNGKPLTPDVVVDETWFSDSALCVSNKLWYMASKTLAEEAAWKFAKETGIDMVTINPGFVIGPLLQPTLNFSAELFLDHINGAPRLPSEIYRFVDVRDVAYAHIQAFEIPSASGRYCLVGRVTHFSDAVKIVHELYPTLPLPEKCADDKPSPLNYEVSKAKAKTLGLDFTPLEVSVKDTIERGSGYIASWLVKLLLHRGYTVKATVRDPNDPKRTEHLLNLDGAKERLHLLKANLVEEGSFDPVVDGCESVFHVASPVFLGTNDPQADLIEPAVKGTLNVLKSCAKFPCVKRVILTSSMASVAFNGKPLTPDVVVDETWFSDSAFCVSNKLWYMASKTLAEEAAWKFAKETGIDMVTINPGFVIGPLLQPTLNSSAELFLDHISGGAQGAPRLPSEIYRFVDVRDVAYAHIQALEIPSASGRYCLVGRVTHVSDAVKIAHELYPTLPLPEKCADDKPSPLNYEVSKAKAKTLGLDFTPLEVSVKDTIENDPKRTEHLLNLDGAKERLHLFKANLVEEGSFDPVVDGCESVFHVASPVLLGTNIDPQADLIEPAVKGTLNVLKSCAKFSSVKRVILTSSMASVAFSGKPLTPDVVVDETWFSDSAFCVSNKTLAEEAAWKFAKEKGIDMEEHQDCQVKFIDLLIDVAYAHIQALEIPSASDDAKKTEHLLALDGAKERLQLFKADLLDEGSFDPVVEGCECVFHTASPFYFTVNDPQAELVDPALKGTVNVLRSCTKIPSIKRVVITSSMAAVVFNGKSLAPDVVVDETWFSDSDFCEKSKLWYHLSKTLAEEAAWKFTKGNGIEMVTLNPGLVIGPLLQPTLNQSAESVLDLINGAKSYPNTTYRWVDVRDVANAHIYALENPSANGRYCLVGTVIHSSEAVKILSKLYPDLTIPKQCADDKPPMAKYQVSKERAASLGVKYTPLEESLKDTIESLKEKNFVSF